MKSILYLLVVYLIVCVFGTAACAAVFMLCSDLTLCVVGQNYSIFSLPFFIEGAFYSFPAVCVFALLSVIFYSIRHKSKKIPVLIIYIVLSFASWFFLIPYSMKASMDYGHLFSKELPSRTVSEGFFRKEKNEVYYYSKIHEDTADGFMVDREGVPRVFSNENLVRSSSTYADSLVQNAVNVPAIISVPLRAYEAIIIASKENFLAGFKEMIVYTSLALAMISIFSLQFISRWRMLNAFSVLAAGIFVLAVNYILLSEFYSLPYFSSNQWVLYINCAIFVLLLVFGIISSIMNYRKAKGS